MSLPCRPSRAASGQLVPLRRLGSGILVLRDQRVMLDETLRISTKCRHASSSRA